MSTGLSEKVAEQYRREAEKVAARWLDRIPGGFTLVACRHMLVARWSGSPEVRVEFRAKQAPVVRVVDDGVEEQWLLAGRESLRWLKEELDASGVCSRVRVVDRVARMGR